LLQVGGPEPERQAVALAGGWQLVVIDGPQAGRSYRLGSEARLGRSADNDVPLADPQASRQHARIQNLMDDYVIADQGSRNGTFVNGVRLAGPARLRDGDLIKIGHSLLKVQAPPTPSQPPQPAYGPAAQPVQNAPAEGIVGVIPGLERRKGLLGSESFSLVLTLERLIFAKMTAEMLKAAVDRARREAKAQGQGFFGQWGAQLGAYAAHARGYLHMPVEAILREHPDNFQIPLAQVRKVQVKIGHADDQQANPDQLVIQAGDKLRFNLKGTSAGQAKKTLRQVLGDRVK
jgi:hypothetical protein